MLAGTALLGAALLLNPPESLGSKTDVLYMKNGDKMTCEIKTMDAGALYVSLDYVDGTISVEWSRVARLESTRLFIVRLNDGTVFTGRMSILPREGTDSVLVRIVRLDGTSVTFDKSQIAGLGGTSDNFWGRLNGSVSSGFGYAKGNNSTTYSFSSAINYPRARSSTVLTVNSNLSSSDGAATSTRNQFTLGSSKLLRWNTWFYSGALSGLQSTEQSISFQGSLSGGVGKYFKDTSTLKISLTGGAAYQSTNYNSSVSGAPEDVIALVIAGRLSFVQFKKKSLSVTANVLPALNDLGRFYFNSNASYFVKLFGAVNWNLSFYGNWDTRPPTGSSGSDYGFNSGLSWTFGNK